MQFMNAGNLEGAWVRYSVVEEGPLQGPQRQRLPVPHDHQVNITKKNELKINQRYCVFKKSWSILCSNINIL